MADSPLKKKTTRSLFWSFIDKFGQQILNFVSMLALMNIVAPEAFGLIGSLAVFTAFSAILVDSGFGRVLLNRKEVSAADYSSVFYFNAALSLLLYLVLFLSAPLIARVFREPSLAAVARVMFLALVFNAVGLIHQTIIVKKADFKGVSKINLSAMLIANAAAIAMALAGSGVWALAAQVVLYALLRSLFFWIYLPWRPTGVFSGRRLKSVFAFGYKLACTSLISAVTNNIYPSLIAAFYPMSQVAYFNQARKYQEIPFATLSNTFRSVAMLILSEINQETERLKRVARKLIKSVAFLSFPVAMVMILVAEPLFHLFFREKWLASVPYFRVLTLAGMFLPFTLIFNELFIAKERSAFFLGLEAVKGVLLILLIVLLFPGGVMGLAASWVIYMVVTLLLSMIFSGKAIRYSPIEFVKDTFPYLFAAAAATAVSWFFTRNITDDLIFVLLNPALVALIHIGICKIFKLEMTKEMDEWFAARKRGQNNSTSAQV